ncbi:uncharacterized protein LOC113865424 isoform X2 [Abrus precatorius]|uniref:Uncharacterized protein LOC113865424 isoform X2 n=1 Tax=Abrus precatorius TaxID=3816 RepID=A0A8B8LHA6_ABRPR|nr:uncharacterized protein LOC113865424 isoform X2 [Abrus precatorius]
MALPLRRIKNTKRNFPLLFSEPKKLCTLKPILRTNDAIDTIIRRDEHTETGEYLRPCIEAALSLGCSLTKPSRSQRNNQRCYLSRRTEEVPNVSHAMVHMANITDHTTKSQHVSENVPSASKKQCLEFSAYPLYYGNNIQLEMSQHDLEVSHVSHTCGPALMLNPSSEGSQSFIVNGDFENPFTNKCDLSLRLGPFTVDAPSFGNDQFQEADVRSKLIVGTSQKDEKLKLRGKFCGSATKSTITAHRF